MYARALNKCYNELQQSLNPELILPYLCASELLSDDDMASIHSKERFKQIEEIKSKLPSKRKGWWEKFLNCLKLSSQEHSPHKYLHELLQKTLEELRQKDHQQPTSGLDDQAPSKPQIDEKKLEDEYRRRFSESIQTSTNNEDLKDEQLRVLIQTVNKNEFYAVMMQLKEDSPVFKYMVIDPLCDSLSCYYVGKWGDAEIPVAIIQTNMGSSGVFGSWYETKKALKNLPNLKYIFAVGVCGGVKGRVKLGDVIVSKNICGYPDLKMTEAIWISRSFSSRTTEQNFYHYLSQAANIPPNTHLGTILSGSWLIKTTVILKKLLKLCPEAIAFEMEGVGIVQACAGKEIEFLIVKGVSDFGDAKKTDVWQPQAAVNTAKYLCDAMTNASLFALERRPED